MSTKEYVVIFLLIVMVAVLASSTINIDNFTHVTRLHDRIETLHGISVHTNNSLTGCAALCLAKWNCWSLFYDFVTKICRLNKSPFLALNETTIQSGFHHYSREFCTGGIPDIAHTYQTFSYINGTPSIIFNCTPYAVQISGNQVMTCDLGTILWSMPTIVCKDLTPYTSMGYTHLFGTESVIKFVGTLAFYDNAKISCEIEGAHLPRPRTLPRWTALAEYAHTQGSSIHIWMDITDTSVEGTLMFSDNSLVPLPYHWLPGKPDPSTAEGFDCVGILPSWKRWEDLPCSRGAYYICEIEL
ncbi:uncharacterized protein LOC117341333 [Pecten maximus]|uniref:uncharacterized protein LOC117341333 n=1 Tax=Pecten maximus TaxID=6579 RepID=UPI0014589B87|nr:uncharacterized protein LOC117341333 [Pecten maximus]